MGVTHCCLKVTMTEQFLHFPDIDSIHKQACGEAVAEGMDGSMFHDPGLFECRTDCGLNQFIANMMPPYLPA